MELLRRHLAIIVVTLLYTTTSHAKGIHMPSEVPPPTANTAPNASAMATQVADAATGADGTPSPTSDNGGYASDQERLASMHQAAEALSQGAGGTPDVAVAEQASAAEPPEMPVEAPGLAELRQSMEQIRAENAQLRQLVEALRTPPPIEAAPPAAAPDRPDPMDIDGHFGLVAKQHLGEHAGEYLTGRYAEALKVVSDWRHFDRDGVDGETRKVAKRHLDRARAELSHIQDAATERERLARLEKRQEELEKRPEQAKREQLVTDARAAAVEYLKADDSPYPAIRTALSDDLTVEQLLAPVDFSTIHDDDSWAHDTENPLDKHLRYMETILSTRAAAPAKATAPAPTASAQGQALVHNPGALAIPDNGTTPSKKPLDYADDATRLAAMRAAAARLPRA